MNFLSLHCCWWFRLVEFIECYEDISNVRSNTASASRIETWARNWSRLTLKIESQKLRLKMLETEDVWGSNCLRLRVSGAEGVWGSTRGRWDSRLETRREAGIRTDMWCHMRSLTASILIFYEGTEDIKLSLFITILHWSSNLNWMLFKAWWESRWTSTCWQILGLYVNCVIRIYKFGAEYCCAHRSDCSWKALMWWHQGWRM